MVAYASLNTGDKDETTVWINGHGSTIDRKILLYIFYGGIMNRPIDNSYISKHRYYELKHFCYQYHEWEKAKSNLKISPVGKFDKKLPDPTGDLAVKLAELESKIEIVDRCLLESAPDISDWLKMCVVDGKSYNVLVSYGVPCGKEYFYTRYKLFFSRLNLCV